jgi:hypothetical protein
MPWQYNTNARGFSQMANEIYSSRQVYPIYKKQKSLPYTVISNTFFVTPITLSNISTLFVYTFLLFVEFAGKA